jgi:antitoxin component YwqK of YwqJK toxin-antitoxin module
MNFLETIVSNTEDLKTFRNFVGLFPETKIISKNLWHVSTTSNQKVLSFLTEMLQTNEFFVGKKIEEIRYRNGLKNGAYRQWHEDDVLEVDGGYLDNKQHGYWTIWDSDGNVQREGNYIKGKRDGLWIERFRNGEIARETNYQRGRKEGTVTTYDSEGNITKIERFINGDRVWHSTMRNSYLPHTEH